jgi:Uri superfamily endonuclease
LEKRIERHLRKNKKHFWHIDYLLDFASIKKVFLFANGKFDECGLSLETLKRQGAKIVLPKFGASDCNCLSHLSFFDVNPTDELMHEERRWQAKYTS